MDQLVAGVEKGSISLPDLQRPFVWPTAKVRDLFDSMYKGYPVGELMFWDVSEAHATRSIAGEAQIAATHQIVDGQQRLTSLFAAIKGLPVRDESYKSKQITISFNPFTEKFEVRTPAIARSANWVEDISTVFKSAIDAFEDFAERYENSGNELEKELRRDLQRKFHRLDSLGSYQFQVVHIQQEVPKRIVADVFVRINSEGVSLKAYDYILTWLSVFWPEGRDRIEEFARLSRVTPERATEITGRKVDWTPKNPYLPVQTGQIIRAMVAVGQNRAKLRDAYSALQAKDRVTGAVDPDKQEHELDLLKSALPIVTDKLSWSEFIHAVRLAGFRSNRGITSETNVISSYVMFLLGRNRYSVPLADLRVVIAQWVFMSQLTSRYTGSGESQLQKDLDSFDAVADGDALGFVAVLRRAMQTALTNDFWAFSVPQSLVTSGPSLSPTYQCYLAALNVLDADMFMIPMKVRDWMDPSQPAAKGMEGHHLFPRAYQEKVLNTTDTKRINQAANFAPTDWKTNQIISDRAPAEYWSEMLARQGGDQAWLEKQLYWHGLPAHWQELDYEEFLGKRRALLAKVVRDGFSQIDKHAEDNTGQWLVEVVADDEISLDQLLAQGLLIPGDLLDSADPETEIDAVVTDDGTILIDGEHEFDSLDEAARHLGVTSMSGQDFWVLEVDGGFAELSELTVDRRS